MSSVVQYLYYAPQALTAAADEAELRSLIDNDTAQLASDVEAFVSSGQDIATPQDVFLLPIRVDGAVGVDGLTPTDLRRRRYRLNEIVDFVDATYTRDISPLERPRPTADDEIATLRVYPAMSAVVAGEWLNIVANQEAFAANLAPGMRIVVDAHMVGRLTLVVEERDGARLRVSGLDATNTPQVQFGDGTIVVVAGIAVSDPVRIRLVSAFNDWRGNRSPVVGEDEQVSAGIGAPALGEAVAEGGASASGTDSSGKVYVAVREPGTNTRECAIVFVPFNAPYPSAPSISLCPLNSTTAALIPAPYADAVAEGFTVRVASPEGALGPATVYAWTFVVSGAQTPVDRRPVSLADFNEGLYRLLYTPTDPSLNDKPLEAVFESYLSNPERIACERDMAKLTTRSFDVTVARTSMAMARGAVLTFQAPYGGAVAGVAGASDIDAGFVATSDEADRLVPTLAAVMRMLST